MQKCTPPFMKTVDIVESANFQGFANGEPCTAAVYDSYNQIVFGSKVVVCIISPSRNRDILFSIGAVFNYRNFDEYGVHVKLRRFDDPNITYAYQTLSARYLDSHALLKKTHRTQFVVDSAIALLKHAETAKINITRILFGVSMLTKMDNPLPHLTSKFKGTEITAAKTKIDHMELIAAYVLARLIKGKEFVEVPELMQLRQLVIKPHCTFEIIMKNFLVTSINQIFGYPYFVQVSRRAVQKAVNKGCAEFTWVESNASEASNRRQMKGLLFQKRNVTHAIKF